MAEGCRAGPGRAEPGRRGPHPRAAAGTQRSGSLGCRRALGKPYQSLTALRRSGTGSGGPHRTQRAGGVQSPLQTLTYSAGCLGPPCFPPSSSFDRGWGKPEPEATPACVGSPFSVPLENPGTILDWEHLLALLPRVGLSLCLVKSSL